MPRNPEEDFCILAQHAKKACNPAGIELPEPSSRAGAMAFKGGGMRTLVRAHDEVPCVTANICQEIRRRISAESYSVPG